MAGPSLRIDVGTLEPREPLGVAAPRLSNRQLDAIAASEMSSLRRGFEAGRMGTDINERLIQESGLRADGDAARADALRSGTRALQLRQATFAPRISRVEQIVGPGDALSWAAANVGQGAASTLDPIAVAGGLTAAGNLVGAIPNPAARVAGAGLRAAGPLGAYALGQRQLAGEFYGAAMDDPTIAARDPREIDRLANTYGASAAVLDTVLPGMVGRQLGGAALRGPVRTMPLRVKAGLGLAGEGATEALQEGGSQALRGHLNPLRDTSGDELDLVNAFAGGAVGAGGPVLAGAGAEALFRGARGGIDAGRQAVSSAAERVMDLGRGARQGIDLGETLKTASAERDDGRLADLNLLRGVPDDPSILGTPGAFEQWYAEAQPRRAARVQQGLADLAGQGDARASELMAGLAGSDPEAQATALETGAEHLIEAGGMQDLAREADAALNPPPPGLGSRVGAVLGKAGRGVAKTALDAAKAFGEGASGKRNAQWTGPELDARRQAGMNAFDEAQAVANDRSRSLERAKLMGEYLAAQTDAQTPRYAAHRVDGAKVKGLMAQTGEELGSLADSWGLTGRQEIDKDKRGDRFDNLKLDLHNIATTMRSAYGADTATVAQSLRKMADPGAAPLFDFLDNEIDQLSKPGAGGHSSAVRRSAIDALLATVPPEAMRELTARGVDLTSAGAGRELLSQVRSAVRGNGQALRALDGVFGKEVSNRMLETLGTTPEQREVEDAYAEHSGDSGLAMGERGEVDEMAQREAAKTVEKGAATRLYGFHGMPRARTDLKGRDPLQGEMGSDGVLRRPRLVPLADKDALTKRTAALERQLGGDSAWATSTKSALQVMAEHDGIALQTALAGRAGRNEVMPGKAADAQAESLGVNPTFINKVVARFRDYMRQDARRGDEEQAKALRGKLREANAVLMDRLDQAEGKAPTRTTAGQRSQVLDQALEYLSSHGMVVAERGTNKDPQQISTEEVLELAERGKKLHDVGRRDGEDRNDVLVFQSKLADSKDPDKPGPLYLRAADVAKFAERARKATAGGEDTGSVSANEQYIRDLSDGIASLVTSKLVEGLPRGFTEGKMPDALPLKTTTYGSFTKAKERRAKAKPAEVQDPGSATYQERVAAEQARESFTPDDSGKVERSDADEFEGQRAQSRAQGAVADVGDEVRMRTFPRMRWREKGPELGAQLRNQLEAVFADGLGQAQRYLRQAATEAQYVVPVIYAVGEGHEALGTTPAEKAAVKVLRGQAAQALSASSFSLADKVTLARAMAKPELRSKVTAQNIQRMLDGLAETADAPVQGADVAPPASKAQQDAASTAAVAEFKDRPAAAKEDAAPLGKSQPRPAGAADTQGARKLNAQATQLHQELKRPGFAATHDSPIKHEGKFNWRANSGKGEGAAAFGAGTYLSTSEAVHKFYKAMFTEKAGEKSPTYQVSVDIAAERLLDWDKPFTEQSSTVRLRLVKAVREHLAPELRASRPLPEAQRAQLQMGPGAEQKSYSFLGDDKMTVISGTHQGQPTALVGLVTPTGVQWGRYKTAEEGFERLRDLASGGVLYQALAKRLGSQDAASDYLQSIGVPGHVYAAAAGKDTKAPNYVIYDDSKISTNFVAFNRQSPSDRTASPEEMAEAKAYVEKVLGPQIKVDFQELTGYSGEWIEATNTIQISTTAAPGTMQTAYHEALHAFFSKFVKGDDRAFEVLKALAEDQKLLARVHALLDGYPAAQAQLADGEERLAYMYQFWAAGQLDLPSAPRTLFERLVRFFRQVFGRIKDSERAVALLEAFHAGRLANPSAAGEVIAAAIDEGTWTTQQLRKLDGLVSKVQGLVLPAQSVLAMSDSAEAQALAKEFWTNPGDEDHAGVREGYINARAAAAMKYTALFSQAVKGLSDRDLAKVAELAQQEADPAAVPYAPHAKALEDIYALTRRFHRYMTEERGLDIGKVSDGRYFPRVWDTGLLLEGEQQFIDMLKAEYDPVLQRGVEVSKGLLNKDQVAQEIHRKLVSNTVARRVLPSRQDGVLAPFFASGEVRELKWLKPEHVEPYLSKDLIGTMTRYFHDGARAAEYAHRFGEGGQMLDERLEKVNEEMNAAATARLKRGEFKNQAEADKWANRRVVQVMNAVAGMEGSIGGEVGSTWRNTSAWITVYQNMRLLPLALFSQFVDPLSTVARGATMREAYDTYLRGMRDVFASWGDIFRTEPKERQSDEWERLALAVGSVDAAIFSSHVADEYSSIYMSKAAKRINDGFFRLNGMEAWNRGMRTGATRSAVMFIERHAKGADQHSARWLAELGLNKGDYWLDGDRLIVDKNELAKVRGISTEQAERDIEKTHYAIRRWVQGAVITPNAAQRPAWSSDPHYSMFFHLKQFSYSFHQTILKRAVNELNYGNLAPMGAFFWYVPVMLASDITKGLLQGGGQLPSHMQGMTLGDWVMRSVERAGLLGVGNIGIDAQQDLFSVAGPAVEQVIDAFGQTPGKTVIDALPGKPLFAEALR